MAITLSKIAADTATAALTIGEDVVNIVYYPSRVTEKVIADMNILADAEKRDVQSTGDALNGILTALVKSWDVMEDDGVTQVPVTNDRLAGLPLIFRIQVIMAVTEDMRGNAEAAQKQNI